MEPTSKEQILKKIRKALINPTPQPFPQVDSNTAIYQSSEMPLDELFATEFAKINGKFIFCESNLEFIRELNKLADEKNWNHLYAWEMPLIEMFQQNDFRRCRIGKSLEKADAGITTCECLVARLASIILTSKSASGRTLSIFPPVHIVVAYTSQLVYDTKDAIQLVMQKYQGNLPSMITIATGPSRTADIEKTLVLGAHGPKEVYVFLIDD